MARFLTKVLRGRSSRRIHALSDRWRRSLDICRREHVMILHMGWDILWYIQLCKNIFIVVHNINNASESLIWRFPKLAGTPKSSSHEWPHDLPSGYFT